MVTTAQIISAQFLHDGRYWSATINGVVTHISNVCLRHGATTSSTGPRVWGFADGSAIVDVDGCWAVRLPFLRISHIDIGGQIVEEWESSSAPIPSWVFRALALDRTLPATPARQGGWDDPWMEVESIYSSRVGTD